MKNILCYLVALLLLFSGCEKSPTETFDPIEISSKFLNVDFESSSSQEKIEFIANAPWKASLAESKVTPDWIAISPESGDVGDVIITITIDKNIEFEDREAILTINAGGESEDIKISQDANSPTLSLDIDSKKVEDTAGEFTINLSSNSSWIIKDVPDWITLSATEGTGDEKIIVSYTANENDNQQRKAQIKFISKGVFKSFPITQKGVDLAVKERAALIELYNATGGDNWNDNTNWGSSRPLNEWFGVSTNSNNRVITVNLFNNNLIGTIPQEISNLIFLEHISLACNSMSGKIPEEIADLKYLKLLDLRENQLVGEIPISLKKHKNWNILNTERWLYLQQEGYGFDPEYESTDFSMDGEVVQLQQATVGKGIDVVILGDGFIDVDMNEGGLYEKYMSEAMENFFGEEPYKTYRDRFNIYSVKAVSKHKVYYKNAETACSDNDKIFEYALKVPTITTTDELLVINVINLQEYHGDCVMYSNNNAAIANCVTFDDGNDYFYKVLNHECGHGFGKLGDEYVRYETRYPDRYHEAIEQKHSRGWYLNVDITDDPTKVQWAHMLSDERYNGLVGIYEGALHYRYGVWRPSVSSMMRDHTGFNAPSREIIFRRIMELSGDTYSYEKFVEYDAKNRTKAAMIRNMVEAPWIDEEILSKLTPPIIIEGKPNVIKK